MYTNTGVYDETKNDCIIILDVIQLQHNEHSYFTFFFYKTINVLNHFYCSNWLKTQC